MRPNNDTAPQRSRITHALFPGGIPRLICPLITPYRADGTVDTARLTAHLRYIRPWIGAVLAPGSTGDGWEMTERETEGLLDHLIAEATTLKLPVMVGVLRTDRGTVVPAIRGLVERYADGATDATALAARGLCGFTVTPPKGAALTQQEILSELRSIAETGVPLAIYQLPQVTENEMSPETVATLVAEFPNVYLLKDTSGRDAVARAAPPLANLALVRGAEGDYLPWLRDAGGPYDGFLLSTANSFARELHQMIALAEAGDTDRARGISDRVSAAVTALFDAAASLPFGNPFANANKAFDHHFAWGPEATRRPGPMTHSGSRLPPDLIARAGTLLTEHGFSIGPGYLQPAGG